MNAHEIYTSLSPTIVSNMLDWFRANDRSIYKSAVASLAAHRKLRPVFIEKKSLKDQYAWIHSLLMVKACNTIGEHLLQAYLMTGQQEMLATFCDGMGIPHDGKGTVNSELPEALDAAKLDQSIETLLAKFDPQLVALYLTCFNLQAAGGWPELNAKLEADERLTLS